VDINGGGVCVCVGGGGMGEGEGRRGFVPHFFIYFYFWKFSDSVEKPSFTFPKYSEKSFRLNFFAKICSHDPIMTSSVT
jgi:hypothetical protein